MGALRYRLALDLGSTSLGWAMVRLNAENEPSAIVKAGVRIFSDGRNPKDGSSLAVTRREARAMRRRRDRLLKRKARMMKTLVDHGFFPQEPAARKALETLNPYELRARGLKSALTGAEFARALFHINQRRGFKSNRKTDKAVDDKGAMKKAISALQQAMTCYPIGKDRRPLSMDQFDWLKWVQRDLPETLGDKPRTVGEFLHQRFTDSSVPQEQRKVRARSNGLKGGKLVYDLYIDRAMIEAEFYALWAKQAELNPALFTEAARANLIDCLLHQRALRPVLPGRCTLEPTEPRATLALPSQQRFRIYQEVNNLRIVREGKKDEPLTLAQRNVIVAMLERPTSEKKTPHDVSFDQIRSALNLSGSAKFNIEDQKRNSLKGNATNASLGKKAFFGEAWFTWHERQQDAIVRQLVNEQNTTKLIKRLEKYCLVDEVTAVRIVDAGLPEGYGSLSAKALARILPELRREVVTFAEAAMRVGYHHSRLSENCEVPGRTFSFEITDTDTGEIKTFHIFNRLPYYGEFMQRHVGFSDPKARADDLPEKRFGRIANPTVHIGLNQVRTVVNALINRYGHPSEVIVEVARELKQNWEQRQEEQKRQASHQERNKRLRTDAAGIRQCSEDRVTHNDIQKLILWEELSRDPVERRCPYSGVQISPSMILTDQVEIDHILPFSTTLDDTLNNKTVTIRQANRIKGNRTPWEACSDFAAQGWSYADILHRVTQMDRRKSYRFSEDGRTKWLKGGEDNDGKGYLARALNDTRYLSRVAREYLSLICPQNTRVIPGGMTSELAHRFGVYRFIHPEGKNSKNRNDHRHHAVDACVIAVTDQGMLQRFAKASASARERQLDRLVEDMPLPWPTYREHVERAISHILVSHKPDHGFEGCMHEDTAYKPPHLDKKGMWRTRGIGGNNPNEKKADSEAMIAICSTRNFHRHSVNEQGQVKPYKGYLGGNNYCIEIIRSDSGKWAGEVISTFDAYQLSQQHDAAYLRNPNLGMSGMPLVMRLMQGDTVRLFVDDQTRTYRVCWVRSDTRMAFAEVNEANVDARDRDKGLAFKYLVRSASVLHSLQAHKVTISPIGELRDPGFKA